MSVRCKSGFHFAGRTYAGGCVVDDDHPILQTHGRNFVKVNQPPVARPETATTDEIRTITPPVSPAKKAPAKKAAPIAAPKNDKPEGEN